MTETTLPRLRAAWCLLQCVLNRALDFNVRILHQAPIGQIAVEFDRRVEEIAARIFGERDSSGCHQRLCIHTLHGGGGLISYSDKSACGYLVAVREVAVGVAQRLGAQGHALEAVTSTLAQRVIPGCIACEQALANRGVQLLIGGGIGRTSDHRASVEEWLRAGPAAKQGEVLQILSELRSEEHAAELSKVERAHFLAAGCEGAGGWHAELPSSWQRPVWSDPVYRVALRFRLGLRVLPAVGGDDAVCSCGAIMDPFGRQTLLCNKGPPGRARGITSWFAS